MTEPLLLKPTRVAEILDCSVRTVYRLVERGELVSHNSNRGMKGVRIVFESVEQYVQRHIVNQPSPKE